ncbi:MAG: protein translocase subunit SecD [Candidatus Krumholzibacteria bacterium]|nr:protein translocase subunit SecD [Candidatus Krumholzibacteria bacterium]
MGKNKWKLLLIFFVLVFSIWALYPSYDFYTKTPEERARMSGEERSKYIERAIKLGLDLQGGMHLVLEVDDSELDESAKKDAVDRAIKILRNRVDQFGVAEPIIQQQGNKRIIIQLPGLQDAERARNLIGQTALLEFRLVRQQEEVVRVLNALDRSLKGVTVEGTVVDSTAAGEEEADNAQVDARAPQDTALAAATPFDSILPTLDAEGVEVPLQQIAADRPFTSYLLSSFDGGVVADERTMASVNALLETPQARRAIPPTSEFLWGHEAQPMQDRGVVRALYLVEKRATLDGSKLIDATTRPDADDPTQLNVGFRLNRQGAIIFSRFTGENIGRRIAIVLDRKVRSAPVVQTKIPGGEGRITGLDTDEEANDLSIVLRAGALPAPVSVIEERSVGPSLGHDSITAGTRAAIVGFIVVMIFMLVYYQAAGVLACGALIFNLVIVLAALAKLHAALTLPGIAGLILTIGMAVDANVLIFERIREELAKAKTVRSAIEAGYDRAFSTILDANVTTLITALVLWQFGTGPIKGFATTLSIGIVASMFTALLCTRVVFDLVTANRQLKKLSI